MQRIIVNDQRNTTRIREVIDWVTKDDFWSANVRSPRKLRAQFERLEIEMQRQLNKKTVPQFRREADNPSRALPYYEDIEAKMRRAGFEVGP